MSSSVYQLSQNHHEPLLLRWAGTTACLLHCIIGILFIVIEREALFGPSLPPLDTERPVLIGDPLGTSDDPHDPVEADADTSAPAEGDAFAASQPESVISEPPATPVPQDEAQQSNEEPLETIAEPNAELPPEPQAPRITVPSHPRPNPESRQARWRRKAPEAKSPQAAESRRSPFRSDGQALHEAFTQYQAAKQTAHSGQNRPGNATTTGNKKAVWGERAQKNAAQLEIDLYIRRLMRAFKDRAAFYEETVSVSHSVHTRVSVVLVIEKSGNLRHIEVRPSTGVLAVDRAIEQFCRYATIPPLPSTFPDKELVLPIQVRIEQAAGVHRMRFTVDTP